MSTDIENINNSLDFENAIKIDRLSPDEISRKFNMYYTFIKNAKMKISPAIDDSAFIGFIGPRRTGKSELSIATAFGINPDFSIDNICFSFDELKKILNDESITKEPVVWEEASVTAYNRDFMEDINKELNKYFQVFGFRNLAIIANFQHVSLLDNHTRMQLDVLLRCKSYYGIDSLEKVFTRKSTTPFKVINDGMNDPLIVPYTVEGDLIYNKIGEIPIPHIDALHKMFGVKNSFIAEYKKRKIEFFKNLSGEKEAELAKKEIAILKKKEEALSSIAKFLQGQGLSQDNIAEMMNLKRQTASRMNIFEAPKVDIAAKLAKPKPNKIENPAAAKTKIINQKQSKIQPTSN